MRGEPVRSRPAPPPHSDAWRRAGAEAVGCGPERRPPAPRDPQALRPPSPLLRRGTLRRAGVRRGASYEDEGVLAILILTFFAVSLCLAAIFALLDQQHDPKAPLEPETGPWTVAIAGASVLLAWLTSHTVMAFRYAHLYYSADDASGPGGAPDAGGLDFPGTDEPQIWDFFYYSFVVGMTSQVSDVQASSARMRRATLIHSIASFVFNTVILALAVNIAVNGHG